MIRAHYAKLLAEARRRGHTQERVAKAGQLAGQNAISKLITNQHLGPSVETFVKAVRGLGMDVSAFFAELEQGAATTPAASEETGPVAEKSLVDRIRELEQTVEVLLAMSNAVPAPTPAGQVVNHNHITAAAPDRSLEHFLTRQFDRRLTDLETTIATRRHHRPAHTPEDIS